ncbi:TAFII55 protein conserved region-domain-containing protein [Dipodascopsis uninucleata]
MIRLKLNANSSDAGSASPTDNRQSKKGGDSGSPPLPKIKVKQSKKGKAGTNTISVAPSTASEKLATPRISIKPPLPQQSGGPARHGLPRIRVKPVRQPGQGYDSEAPDREDDPLIEEGLIFRFEMESFSQEEQSDRSPYLERLRAAIEGQDFGDVWIKFKDPRHAIVGIHDRLFYAVLVDLPCIIETQKTLDRKNIYKVSDICQMLLVLDKLQSESEFAGFKSKILPDDELQKPEMKKNRKEELPYPHGITPPMRFARQRRFRKRIIKVVENEHPKQKPIPKVVIRTKALKQATDADEDNSSSMSNTNDFDLNKGDATDDLPQTPGAEFTGGREGSVALSEPDVPYNMLGGYGEGEVEELEGTEAGDEIESLFGNESDEDEDEDDEDDNDEDEGKKQSSKMDDDELEALHHTELLKEEISELEITIKSKERDAENATNPILRNRFLDVVSKLNKELSLKRNELDEAQQQ